MKRATITIPDDLEAELERWLRTQSAGLPRQPREGPIVGRLLHGADRHLPSAVRLNHVGQIALLRRLVGAPVRGENYFKAEIAVGRVGPEQAAHGREFD
jgi:hypothetical protein